MFPLYLCNFVNRHCFVIILFWIQLGLHTLYISTSRSSKDILWISNERVGDWGGGVMFSILNQEILFGNKVCAFLYVQYGVSYLLLLYSQWHDIPDFLVLIYLSISALLEFNSFPWAYHTKHVAVDLHCNLSRNNCSHWLNLNLLNLPKLYLLNAKIKPHGAINILWIWRKARTIDENI